MVKTNTKFRETELGPIPEEWDIDGLGNRVKIFGGKRLPKEDSLLESRTDHPYIRITDFGDFGVNKSGLKYISNETHEKIKRYIIEEGDIYISNVGTIGLVGIIKDDLSGANLTENAVRLTGLRNLDNYFLAYYLKSNIGQDQIRQNTVGAVQPKLPIYGVGNIKIPIPTLDEQRSISSILSSLDDKIELNRQINANLEKIASALFKRWFVDFEFPDENGKPYKSSGGKMVESELGEIPEGWRVGMIKDMLSVEIGGDWGAEVPSEGLEPCVCLRGTDLESLKTNGFAPDAPVRYVKTSSIHKRMIGEKDVLIGGSGLGPVGRSQYMTPAIKQLYQYPLIYSNFCKRLVSTTVAGAVYAERVLEAMYLSGDMHSYINGTSIPNLDANRLMGADVILPTEDVLASFNKILQVIYETKFSKENLTLRNLRDSLLPRLMSGGIRVKI